MGRKRRFKRKPRNEAKHREWRKMFTVEPVEERPYVKLGPIKIPAKQAEVFYVIRERDTGKIVGKYNDFKYATRQAWYKYKRRLRKIERLLLVEDL